MGYVAVAIGMGLVFYMAFCLAGVVSDRSKFGPFGERK
jgi:hypothetical protein